MKYASNNTNIILKEPISRGLAEESPVLRRALSGLMPSSMHKLRSFIFAKEVEDSAASSDLHLVMRSPLKSPLAFQQLCQTFFLSPMDAYRAATADPALSMYIENRSGPAGSCTLSFSTVSQEDMILFFFRCIQGELYRAAASPVFVNSGIQEEPNCDVLAFPLSLECALLVCACIAYYQQCQCPVGAEGLELLRHVFAQCVEAEEEERRLEYAKQKDDEGTTPLLTARSLLLAQHTAGAERPSMTSIRWTSLKHRLKSFCSSAVPHAHRRMKDENVLNSSDVSEELAHILASAVGEPLSFLGLRRYGDASDDNNTSSPVASPSESQRPDTPTVSFDEFLDHLRHVTFATHLERSRWKRRVEHGDEQTESSSPQTHSPVGVFSSPGGFPMESKTNVAGIRGDALRNAIFDVDEHLVDCDVAENGEGASYVGDNDSLLGDSSADNSLASYSPHFEQVDRPPHASSAQLPSASILISSTVDPGASYGGGELGGAMIGRSGGVTMLHGASNANRSVPIDMGTASLLAASPHASADCFSFLDGNMALSSSLRMDDPTAPSIQQQKKKRMGQRKSVAKQRSPSTVPLGFTMSPLDKLRCRLDESVSKLVNIRSTTDLKMNRCVTYVKKDLAIMDRYTGESNVASTSVIENNRRLHTTMGYAPTMTAREEDKVKKMLAEYNVDKEMEFLEKHRKAQKLQTRAKVSELRWRARQAEQQSKQEETDRTRSLVSREDALVKSIASAVHRQALHGSHASSVHAAQRRAVHALQCLRMTRREELPSRSSEGDRLSPSDEVCSTMHSSQRRHRPLPTPTPGPGESPIPRRNAPRSPSVRGDPQMSLSPCNQRTDSVRQASSIGRQASSGSYELLIEADGIGQMRTIVTAVYSFPDLLESLDDLLGPFQHEHRRRSIRGGGKRGALFFDQNVSQSLPRRRVSDVFLEVAADSHGIKTKYIPLGSIEELPHNAKVRVVFD